MHLSRTHRRLLKLVGRASAAYGLIEPGDRVAVAVSGGKDSLTLLHLLEEIRRRAPFAFELVAITLDSGAPGFPIDQLRDHFVARGYAHHLVAEDTYSIVRDKTDEGQSACALCARLRRGVLYNAADRLGATKLALGHHREDLTETLVLNLFYSGQLKAMAPKLRSDDGRNVVIRPLLLCPEADLARLACELALPVVPPGACALGENPRRAQVRELVRDLTADNPNVPGNLLRALGNVRLTHLLDRRWLSLAESSRDARTPSDSR